MLLRGIGLAALLLAIGVGVGISVSPWLLPGLFVLAYLALLVVAFAFLCLACAVVDLQKPQAHDSPFYRRLADVYIEALLRLALVRVHPQGLEKLPSQGRFLLVCNHLFVADPAILLNCFPRSQLAFITKQENQRLFVVGKLMHKILCQPLDREHDRAALKTILRCVELLQNDEVSIAVFPEGYTSKDGFLHSFRPGVFKIAQRAQVPIVVCTIQGTRKILPNLKRLRPTDVAVHLVEVLPPQALAGRTAVDISNQVHDLMLQDLGEEFRPSQSQTP